MDILQMRLCEIEIKQSKFGFGEFLWKIENLSAKKRQAENNIETRIISDVFYSHKFGYQMGLAFYPNGDDDGYCDLYFYIMRGRRIAR